MAKFETISSIVRYVKRFKVCASSKPTNLPKLDWWALTEILVFLSNLFLAIYLVLIPGALVVVDWFRKYTLVYALPKATASVIVKIIENQVFIVFGVMQIMSCDNSKQFTSKVFKELMNKYSVQKIWFNANFHPQINHTERVN